MKLRAAIRRMLQMCPEAWRIFLRLLQLSCFFLLCALMLLIGWDGDPLSSYRFLQLSGTLQEMAQLALLGAVLIPPIVEERHGRAK